MSANAAGRVRVGGGVYRSLLCHHFGISFHGKTLHSLQSRGNGFLARLGTPHFRIKPLINFAQCGIVRVYARPPGFGLGRGGGGLGKLLVFIFVFIHDSDREADEFILAQVREFSSAGKFDLAFGFGGHAVAGCGTIPPGANRSQHNAVTDCASAFQNEGTVYTSIGSDDEADFHFLPAARWNQHRIRRG